MEKIKKRRILFILKILITVIILVIIFRKLHLSDLYCNFIEIPLRIIVLLLLTTIIKLTTQYLNWKKYLKINPDFSGSNLDILKSYFIGDALRFILPGGYGTFGKIYFLNNKKVLTAISIGLEKFFQIWVNLLFASFAAIFFFESVSIYLKLILFLLILFLPLIIYTISFFWRAKKIYFKQYLKIIPHVLFLQLLHNFLTIIQYYLILNIFISISFFKTLISVSLFMIANIIPITYSGLGLRETFAINILAKADAVPEVAVTSSLTIFFFNLVLPAFLGLYFILKSRKKD